MQERMVEYSKEKEVITMANQSSQRKGKAKKKQEALTVQRLIHEVLVGQLSIPLRQIVNDTTFAKYTGSKRPDLLISEFEYDPVQKNEDQFINNLVAYAEAKDDCIVDSTDWEDAIKQGLIKAPKLNLPYFIVTNGKTSIFYNAKTKKEIKLNGNPGFAHKFRKSAACT
jgi:type I restriction enzyme M protein